MLDELRRERRKHEGAVSPKVAEALAVAETKLSDAVNRDETSWVVEHWRHMSSRRNDMLHHGYRQDNVWLTPEYVREIEQRWHLLKNRVMNSRNGDWKSRKAGVPFF